MMPLKTQQRVKIYIVIVLSLLFFAIGYFRFIHGRPGVPKERTGEPGASVATELRTANVSASVPAGRILENFHEPPRAKLRNIFAPAIAAGNVNRSASAVLETPKPPTSLKLTGTIVGGRKPIAIINGRLLRSGDRIDGFQVVAITGNRVFLKGEGGRVMLNVLESREDGKP
jgi:hypothetical protein